MYDMIKPKFAPDVVAPGPLLHVSIGVCITYNPDNMQLMTASSCDETMFYYDGEYIREATTHLCIETTGTYGYATVCYSH